MTPKLYKATDVCDVAQVQPYVLRSWEKEFPGIGVQKSAEGPRLYRQSDLDQVLRIKQLVFGEGLTLAGARRRLEGAAPIQTRVAEQESAEVLETLGADARAKVEHVREGLRLLLDTLSHRPGAVLPIAARSNGRRDDEEYELRPPTPTTRPAAKSAASPARGSAARGKSARTTVTPSRNTKSAPAKRKRATA